MAHPTISVIMAVYNTKKEYLIEDALEKNI